MASAPPKLRALALLLIPVLGVGLAWLWLAGPSDERRSAVGSSPVVAGFENSGLQRPAGIEQQVAPEPVVTKSPEPEPSPEASPRPEVASQPESKPRSSSREDARSPQGGAMLVEARGTMVVGRLQPPVAGALVLAGGAGALPLDAEATVEAASGNSRRAGRGITNAQGEFAIPLLAPGRLRLAVRAEGYAPMDLEHLWLLEDEVLDVGELELERPVLVPLAVVDSRGLPLEGASVYRAALHLAGPWTALDANAFALLGEADGAGSFLAQLRPGPFRLCVRVPGRPATYVSGFKGLPGEREEKLLVTLAEGASLHGELVDVDAVHGKGEGLVIGAHSLTEPLVRLQDLRQVGLPLSVLERYREVRTDEHRSFVFKGLRPREAHRLRVLSGEPFDVPDAFSPLVSASAGSAKVELFARSGAGLEFDLVDARSGARVRGMQAQLPGVSPRDLSSLGGQDGLVRWRGLRAHWRTPDPLYADLPESGDLQLSLSAPGYDLLASNSFRLRSGEVTKLGKLGLNPLTPVHLHVSELRSGDSVAGAACTLEAVVPEQAFGRSSSSQVSDSRGRARLTTLASNAADLVVRREGFAPWRGRAPRAPSPDAPFEVRLELGARLRVRALDGAGNPVRAQVLRRKAGAEVANALIAKYETRVTDGDGWAEFEDLEASIWSVAARALPRSDLELPADPTQLTWVGASTAEGQVNEVDVVASSMLSVELELVRGEDPLPYALVRLQPGSGGFEDPHADAARLALWPTARCDDVGRVVFGDLPPGDYTLLVEHPAALPGTRWPILVEPGSRFQRLDLALPTLEGRVLRDDDRGTSARVQISAFSGAWYEGLEPEVGSSLRDIVPVPIPIASDSTDSSGRFLFRGVPRDVPLRISVSSARSEHDYADYYVESVPGERGSVAVEVVMEAGTSFRVISGIDPAPVVPIQLGLIALHRKRPWGQGVVAAAFERGSVELERVPTGRWQMRLVELEGGHVIRGLGAWFEVDAPERGGLVALPWRAR